MVNMYELKLTTLQERIMRLLFIKAGMSLNQRGIARILEVSQPAVKKAVPELEKNELIKVSKDQESGRWSIELNRDSPKVIGLKRADNLKQLYESGFIEFLHNEFPGATIILFGSYADGEDTIDSDIDLAIIETRRNEKINWTKYHKLLERAPIINYYSSFQKIDKHVLNNILDGITLKGAVSI